MKQRCGGLHRPRKMSDTTAGICMESDKGVNTFWVHCLQCCQDFGPFPALAAAQEHPRYCPTCVVKPCATMLERKLRDKTG